MRALVPLPSFSGVGTSQTATVNIPVGTVTYHKIQLAFGCTNSGNGSQTNTELYLTNIRLKMNGKVQRAVTVAQLDSINAYFNRAFQSRNSLGYVELFLSEPWRRTWRGEDLLAWGTANVNGGYPIQSLSLEVDMAAGVTGPTLVGHAVQEYVARAPGVISKWYSGNVQVGAAGNVAVNSWNKSAGAYQAIHNFMVNATDITSLDVVTDQIDRYNGSYYDVFEWMQSQGWTPQSKIFPIHFDNTARIQDALAMNYLQQNPKGANLPPVPTGPQYGNFQVTYNMNAANSFNTIACVLGNPD